MNNCAILGAGGHGKVVAEVAILNGLENVEFFDDKFPYVQELEHWKVVGNTKDLCDSFRKYDAILIAIGNNSLRLDLYNKFFKLGAKLPTLIHPSAVISKYSKLGGGSVVMPNACITSFATIGDCCIINTASSIDHDCHIGDGVHLSPGARLGGGVNIGRLSWIGMGAKIIQGVKIAENNIVGAGATVLKNTFKDQTLVGVPAVSINK